METGDRVLVVNADDLGLHEDINRGIETAHVDGIVTTWSLRSESSSTSKTTAGWEIEQLSYVNSALFPPIAAVRLLQRVLRATVACQQDPRRTAVL